MLEQLRFYFKQNQGIPFLRQSKQGRLELDELGKLILGLVLLIILVMIIGVVISGEFSNQGDKTEEVLDSLK